jgi:hypothetical protein
MTKKEALTIAPPKFEVAEWRDACDKGPTAKTQSPRQYRRG